MYSYLSNFSAKWKLDFSACFQGIWGGDLGLNIIQTYLV